MRTDEETQKAVLAALDSKSKTACEGGMHTTWTRVIFDLGDVAHKEGAAELLDNGYVPVLRWELRRPDRATVVCSTGEAFANIAADEARVRK